MLVPWKKSYDQPRQHIKKQRHYFANKGQHSQGCGFFRSYVWMWELDHKESWVSKNWYFLTEGSWDSLGLQGDPTSPSWRKSVLNIHCKEWCWSWNSNTLGTWCKELTLWKGPWCWERLQAGEGDDRGWDGWMASPTLWTWVKIGSRSWWWTRMPDVLQFMGSQKVGHDWATNLTDMHKKGQEIQNFSLLLKIAVDIVTFKYDYWFVLVGETLIRNLNTVWMQNISRSN